MGQKWLIKGQISSEWRNYVVNEDAQPGKNATLYKTHKANIPVRLLTTGCNIAIENLSRFVELVCAPLSDKIMSRIKDTSHLLDIIDNLNEQGFPRNTILVSLDIVNMFPNIDNEKGLKAVEGALNTRSVCKHSTACVLEALCICLFNNNSVFGNQHLLQENGTATGAPNSCSYSDLAIVPIDDQINSARTSSFKELIYYGRYRDDCLALWAGEESRLQFFLEFMNTLDEKLKFTMEIGGDSICFLDLKISIKNNKLETTVYSKPTDSHLYLHATSCHKKSSVVGIQKGVALRLRRICSQDAEYNKVSKEYSAYLVNRDHDPHDVTKNFEQVGKLSRTVARTKRKPAMQNKTVIFATTYSPQGPNISKIIKKHEHLLQIKTENIFPSGSIMVANKRVQNLKELMVRGDPYNIKSDSVDTSSTGYVKCGRSCESCNKFVDVVDSIKCFATKKVYKIRRSINCNMKNVIYVAYCIKCFLQGVGSTTVWKPRMRNYKSHIKNANRTCCIVEHFLDVCKGVENIRFILVDCLDNVDGYSVEEIDDLLLQKEKFWIGTLVTQHKGLNSTHDWVRTKRNERN